VLAFRQLKQTAMAKADAKTKAEGKDKKLMEMDKYLLQFALAN